MEIYLTYSLINCHLCIYDAIITTFNEILCESQSCLIISHWFSFNNSQDLFHNIEKSFISHYNYDNDLKNKRHKVINKTVICVNLVLSINIQNDLGTHVLIIRIAQCSFCGIYSKEFYKKNCYFGISYCLNFHLRLVITIGESIIYTKYVTLDEYIVWMREEKGFSRITNWFRTNDRNAECIKRKNILSVTY